MTLGLLILGPRCQNCDRPVPQSIAALLGDEFNGYLCANCQAWKLEQKNKLLAEMAEARQNPGIRSSELPVPCAICGKRSRKMAMVNIDGRIGLVCANTPQLPSECERKWREKNREKLGPGVAYRLKLK